MNKLAADGLGIVRSRKFFVAIVIILVVQAVWFALTARYPLAFDENFHFGIIKLYAHQWGPYFATEPPNSGAYGELVRTSSFLYHYLMSFPYRLIALFTSNETTQIIFLRLINIGLFAGGLILFRRVLHRLHVSAAVTNTALFMLVLIPVVPFLAAHINYDNLVFLVIPMATLLALRAVEPLRTERRLSLSNLIGLLAVCMLASLIKYAYTPIFLAFGIYVLIMIWRYRPIGTMVKATYRHFWSQRRLLHIGLVIVLLISGGMFVERYGINLIKYHGFEPDCAVLRNVDECMLYGPFARNYNVKQGVVMSGGSHAPYDPNPTLFVPAWIDGMMERLYFAINYNYSNLPGLPIILFTSYAVGAVGLILCFVFARWLFSRHRQLLLPLLVTVIYTGSVFYVNLNGYIYYHTMQAINGRYLILIFPFAFVFMIMAYGRLFQKIAKRHTQTVKVGFLTLVFLLLMQGAGALTFLVRSDPGWWWPNQTVVDINQTAKNIVSPLVIGD